MYFESNHSDVGILVNLHAGVLFIHKMMDHFGWVVKFTSVVHILVEWFYSMNAINEITSKLGGKTNLKWASIPGVFIATVTDLNVLKMLFLFLVDTTIVSYFA